MALVLHMKSVHGLKGRRKRRTYLLVHTSAIALAQQKYTTKIYCVITAPFLRKYCFANKHYLFEHVVIELVHSNNNPATVRCSPTACLATLCVVHKKSEFQKRCESNCISRENYRQTPSSRIKSHANP